jgi:mitochondrial import receptor subunit TOM22
MGGKALFVLSTSALLLGVPWALAFAEEQQVVEMEKEMRMREMGSEVSFLGGEIYESDERWICC